MFCTPELIVVVVVGLEPHRTGLHRVHKFPLRSENTELHQLPRSSEQRYRRGGRYVHLTSYRECCITQRSRR